MLPLGQWWRFLAGEVKQEREGKKNTLSLVEGQQR